LDKITRPNNKANKSSPFLSIFVLILEIMNKDLLIRVEEALQQIRPYLEADGGNVSLVEVTSDFIVKLELHGACKTCSMSMMTMKAGIEESIRRAVPEIISVEAINLTPASLS
jgi:Fe-S cluster biogenesis protein NfuA